MKLIAGLGNPGPDYERTRHNVGYEVLDRVARRLAPGQVAKSKFHGALLDGAAGEVRLLLLKPLSFMNRSGQAVSEAIGFYKLDPAEDLLILVDDIALPCGAMRLRADGGAGGHNGLADIEQRLGSDRYARLRVGIDPPGEIPQSAYVLGRFRPEQRELVEPTLDEAADAATCWAQAGINEAMNRYNRSPTAS